MQKNKINNLSIYLYGENLLLMANKPGDAPEKYEQAIHFGPTCKETYLKYVTVYQGVTANLSIEMLRKVITAYSDYLLAYRNLGNIYAMQGVYSKAVTAYQSYMADNIYTVDDLFYYASALFFNKQYTDADKVIHEGQALDPKNFLHKRLSIYYAVETKAYEKGLEDINTFFNNLDSKYIWQDYMYYGRFLNESKQYDKAIEALLKALKESETRQDIYKDLADTQSNNEKDNDAIQSYTKYITSLGNAAEAADFYQLGKYYYSAAAKDSIIGKEFLIKADSLFAIIKNRVPDSHLGSLWQARTQSQLDPETEQGEIRERVNRMLSLSRLLFLFETGYGQLQNILELDSGIRSDKLDHSRNIEEYKINGSVRKPGCTDCLYYAHNIDSLYRKNGISATPLN